MFPFNVLILTKMFPKKKNKRRKKNKTKPAPNTDITSLLFRTEAQQNIVPERREGRESGRGLRAAPEARGPHAGPGQRRGEARLRRGAILPGLCECSGARRLLSPSFLPRIRRASPPRGRPVGTAGAVRGSGISRRRKAKGSWPEPAASAPA